MYNLLASLQRDPGLEGIAWSNPFVAPCSPDGIRECGAIALDFQLGIPGPIHKKYDVDPLLVAFYARL
eukprot:scaffold208018_cov18-Tisochrysis_lutea.AAC.1